MKKNINLQEDLITREEALKKLAKYSKYTVLTALGTYMILSPQKAQAQSPEVPGGEF